jgi:hypothetical protein
MRRARVGTRVVGVVVARDGMEGVPGPSNAEPLPCLLRLSGIE